MENYWQILPPRVVKRIRATCKKNLSVDDELSIKEDIHNYISDTALLKKRDIAVYKYFQNKKISLDNIKRALNERSDNGVYVTKRNRNFLNLLCWYAYDRNWNNTLKYLKLKESELEKRIGGANGKITKKNIEIKSKEPNLRLPSNIQYLDSSFWSKLKRKPDNSKIARFYTHTDSTLIDEVIALDDKIVTPNYFFKVKDQNGNIEEKIVPQILAEATSESLSLIKILSEAGTGKSTFLHWLAKNHYNEFSFLLISKIDEECIRWINEIAASISSLSSKPVIFLIDDVASPEISIQLKHFVLKVKSDISYQKAIIVADRESRYNTTFRNFAIEKYFAGNCQEVVYSTPDKTKIFETLYKHLVQQNPTLKDKDNTIKDSLRAVFVNESVTSLPESIFLLLRTLKLDNIIDYTWDWEEWDEYTNNSRYFQLEHLFTIVSSFYQFGIKVPVALKSSHLPGVTSLSIIKAINSFGTKRSPLVLDDDDTFLRLKHEYIASWYLRTSTGESLSRAFVRDFVNEIDNIVSAKLLRKLRQYIRLKEFKESPISQELSLEVLLKTIDRYLERRDITEEDERKMITERAIVLRLMGRQIEAKVYLETLLKHQPNDPYLTTVLISIYEQLPESYIEGIDFCIKLIENGEIGYVNQLYRLIRKCRRNGIAVAYDEKYIISQLKRLGASDKIKARLAKDLLYEKQYNFCKIIIGQIKQSSLLIGSCYYQYASSLPLKGNYFNDKIQYFEKAIDTYKTITGVHNYSVIMELCMVFFRIGKISTSRKILHSYIWRDKKQYLQLRQQFDRRMSSVASLVFLDIPSEKFWMRRERYLRVKLGQGAGLVNEILDEVSIHRGYLILRAVERYSKEKSEIYFEAIRRLAYCYNRNAVKQWNSFTEKEKRFLAESLYDLLLDCKYPLKPHELWYMLDNLISIGEKIKIFKATELIKKLIKEKEYRNYPAFYRMKAKVKLFQNNFIGALNDIKRAIKNNDVYDFGDNKHYQNDKGINLYEYITIVNMLIVKSKPINPNILSFALKLCKELRELNYDYNIQEIQNNIQDLIMDT